MTIHQVYKTPRAQKSLLSADNVILFNNGEMMLSEKEKNKIETQHAMQRLRTHLYSSTKRHGHHLQQPHRTNDMKTKNGGLAYLYEWRATESDKDFFYRRRPQNKKITLFAS